MDIIKQFNLPSYVKGKTFSEASALIAKKFEGKSSPEDVDTLNELQGRLRDAQEYVKAEQQKRSTPQQVSAELPSGNSGAEPSGSEPASNQFDGGGGLLAGLLGGGGSGGFDISSLIGGGSGGGSGTMNMAGGAAGYAGAAMGALDLGKMAFSKTGIDTSGIKRPDAVPSKGSFAAEGAMKGVQAGKVFGPWGMAIGGALGTGAGLLKGGKMKRDQEAADLSYDQNLHNKAVNDYKSGGQILANMFEGGGGTDPNPYAETEALIAEMKRAGNQNKFAEMGLDDASLDMFDVQNKTEKNRAFSSTLPNYTNMNANADSLASIDKGLDTGTEATDKPATKFNPGELLRYAPAGMNIAQLAMLKKPEQVGFDRLGNRYNEQLVDEKGLQNVAQESVLNNRNAILSSSGGSGSAARANLLASQLQGGKTLSQAYIGAGAENRQEKRAGQQFNLGVDQANIGQSNLEKQTNLQLDAAYQTNKSKLLSQLGDDLGGIGQEELFKKYPELMGLSYGSRGEYLASKKKKKGSAV